MENNILRLITSIIITDSIIILSVLLFIPWALFPSVLLLGTVSAIILDKGMDKLKNNNKNYDNNNGNS